MGGRACCKRGFNGYHDLCFNSGEGSYPLILKMKILSLQIPNIKVVALFTPPGALL